MTSVRGPYADFPMIECRTAKADIHLVLPSEFDPLRTFDLKIEWLLIVSTTIHQRAPASRPLLSLNSRRTVLGVEQR